MEIELKEINRTNWLQCIELKVCDSQLDFVVPIACSLVKAAYEPDTYPFAIYCDNNMVGYVMYEYNSENKVWEMVDLMIDERFQGQGIGTIAIKVLLETVVKRLGHIKFYTSAAPANKPAIRLYEKIGFKLTGCTFYDELEMEIQL